MIDMNNLVGLLISDDLIKRILELSDKFDTEYFVDQFNLNDRIAYIKENLLD